MDRNDDDKESVCDSDNESDNDGGYHTDEEEFDEQTDCAEGETVIVGADAKALYSSMEGDIIGTISITKLVATNTRANFGGQNYKEMARYVVMESTPAETSPLELLLKLTSINLEVGITT